MPRHARKEYETLFFHIIVQGIDKEYIFNREEDIMKYLNIIGKKLKESEIKIISYCIMNNHAHFLIYAESIKELSAFMSKINTSYAKYYNKEKDRVGYVFRDRYKSEPIMSEAYLIKCINYIHNNPVKANIVKKCADYKYSSYSKFLRIETIKKISKIANIDLDIRIFKEPKVEEEFLDIDIDRKEIILKYINEFQKNKGIQLFEVYTDREILKELIHFLKGKYLIKYTEMMDIMGISKGTMQSLKR